MIESIPDLLTRLEQDHLLKGLDGEQQKRLIAQVNDLFSVLNTKPCRLCG
jgi:hypothetical protein